MNKEDLIKLTLGVYKVTELLPKQEPLRFFLRKKANEILEKGILLFGDNPISSLKSQKQKLKEEIIEDIKVMEAFLGIGKSQNWIDKRNFLVLERTYLQLIEKIEKQKGASKPKVKIDNREDELNENFSGKEEKKKVDDSRKIRCRKILEILQHKEKAQVWEFKEIFPEVSKRTLRRDFEYLLKNGLIKRIGEGKFTYYTAIGQNRTTQ